MLGGLLLWAVHFIGVYVIASLADTVADAADSGWRLAGLVFSAVSLAAAGVLWLLAARRLRRETDETARFRHWLALFAAVLATTAIAWQTLPHLVGY